MLKWSDNKEEKKRQIIDCENLLKFTMQLLYDDRFNGNNIKVNKKLNRQLSIKGGFYNDI